MSALYIPKLWPPSGEAKRPWICSRLVSRRDGVIDWTWLRDRGGHCRKFATRDAAQAACDVANGLATPPEPAGDQVLSVLADGPALTGEVAAELGWTSKRTAAHLCWLHKRGKVSRSPHRQPRTRLAWLWTAGVTA